MKVFIKFILFSFLFLFIPDLSYAQVINQVDGSGHVMGIFLNILDWSLLGLFLLGLIMMPVSAILWYRRTRPESKWIDFFRSGSFMLRFLIVITAFIFWQFKILDSIVSMIFDKIGF